MKRLFALLSLFAVSMALATPAAKSRPPARSSKKTAPAQDRSAEAIHLNNLGAAYMNQQQFKRALQLFQQAAALDAKLEATRINQGIALLNLQQYAPALSLLEKISQPLNTNSPIDCLGKVEVP